MAAGRAGNLEAAGNGDALVEAHYLQGDLALVVEHRDDAVEITAECLHEQGVGRIRSAAVPALGFGPLDCRGDHVDLLTSAGAVLTRMGIQRCDCDVRILHACVGQGRIHQGDGAVDLLAVVVVQGVADFLDRDVAGGAGRPDLAHNIDLPEGGGVVQELRHIPVLALQVQSGILHSRLVQRSKAEAGHLSFVEQLNAGLQHIQAGRAGFHSLRREGSGGRIQIVSVQERRSLAPVRVLDLFDHLKVRVGAGDLLSSFKDPDIAHKHRSAVLVKIVPRGKFCHDLRSHTCGISEAYADDLFLSHDSFSFLFSFPGRLRARSIFSGPSDRTAVHHLNP